MRELLSSLRRTKASVVQRPPAHVLQGRQGSQEGSPQLKGDFLPVGVDQINVAPLDFCLSRVAPASGVRPFPHVVRNEFQHAVKLWKLLGVLSIRLQEEAAVLAVDAQVLRSASCLHGQGEEVVVVCRVADEESAGRLGAQQGAGLPSSDGAPVEATLLELTQSSHHLLVVFMRAEGLVVMRGKVWPLNPALRRGRTAHGEEVVLSTEGYHGAMAPRLCRLVERQGAEDRSFEADRREGALG